MNKSRGAVVGAVVGFLGCGFVGALVGFMNRPTYLGGLVRTTGQDLMQNQQLMQDAAVPVVTYGLLFALMGAGIGALIGANVSGGKS